MSFFLTGLLIGLSIAAPVGPIGVLCIRKTLAHGRLAGWVCGMGAATADALYGAVAAFGLTAVSGVMMRHQAILGLAGGLFLCYLGIRTFLAKPATADDAQPAARGLAADYGLTLLLTLTNPTTILSFAGVFAGLGLGVASSYAAAAAMVAGVFLGSAAWWLVLAMIVGAVRTRLPGGAMIVINRLSGATFLVFGVIALSRAL